MNSNIIKTEEERQANKITGEANVNCPCLIMVEVQVGLRVRCIVVMVHWCVIVRYIMTDVFELMPTR